MISLAGKLLVSRIQELALWNTFPEALQLSSGLGKKVDMEETPARFADTIEAGKVDQPKLMFTVNQLVVLRGITVYKGTAAAREVTFTIKQVSECVWADTAKFNESLKPSLAPLYSMADLHKLRNTHVSPPKFMLCTHLRPSLG